MGERAGQWVPAVGATGLLRGLDGFDGGEEPELQIVGHSVVDEIRGAGSDLFGDALRFRETANVGRFVEGRQQVADLAQSGYGF